MMARKGLMVILDGLGDRGIPSFGGKTPLEVAQTPNMDRLASAGQCGLADPLYPGMPVGTHTGICPLFGLSQKQSIELARGPIEASGVGLNKGDRTLYLRCNFATVKREDTQFRILDRRAGRINEGTESLAQDLGQIDLEEGITASLHPATQHRVVLQLEGVGLSNQISNTDPGNEYRNKGLLSCHADNPSDPDASRTARAINRLMDRIHDKLDNHPVNQSRIEKGLPPANGILCRSPGKLPSIKPLLHHLKLQVGIISGERTILGLGRLLGYRLYENPKFTSNKQTDLNLKVETAIKALDQNDLVFLHIKAPDIASHDLDPIGKQEILAKIDDALAPLINDELVIGITADHSTDSNTGRHTGDPIPCLIYNPCGRVDACTEFTESACARGSLGRITNFGFLLTVLDQMNRLENFSPKERLFLF
jgi:2,3-bisphosphoglycerate-independent phosphoglycerate mutase